MLTQLQRLTAILFFSAILAVANFFFNPAKPDWNPDASLSEGEVLFADVKSSSDDYLWIDARAESEFSQAHYPDAINLNLDNWNAKIIGVLDKWDTSLKIIVYCSSRACDSSHAVAEKLRSDMGLSDVFVLHGGWESLNLELADVRD